MTGKKCCTPSAEQEKPKTVRKWDLSAFSDGTRRISPDCVSIPGGRTLIGTNTPELPQDAEGPLRQVKVKPFLIEPTTVTNAMFSKFVEDTGYITEAEDWG
jgi:formylglycine-generating enzyme required for sulfatase activity